MVTSTARGAFPLWGVSAGGANTVNNSSSGADSKAVVVKNMAFHLVQKFAAQVDKLSALDTLQMKMLGARVSVKVLIAGAATLPDYHFFDNTLVFKLFKGAVNGGSAYVQSLLPQVNGNVRGGYVRIIFFKKV